MSLSDPERWVLYTDGGARGNPGPGGSGFVLMDASGTTVCSAGHYLGVTTNNRAEYDGLVRGLRAARAHGCERLEVRMDSELIVRQMTGLYRVKNEGLKGLFADAQELLAAFRDVRFVHVRREENTLADRLANDAMDAQGAVGDPDVDCDDRAQGTLF